MTTPAASPNVRHVTKAMRWLLYAAAALVFLAGVQLFIFTEQTAMYFDLALGADPIGMPLDRLLASSDIVSIHCPLTPETRHLINQASLARMKRSAYLVNTSRGPVVDEGALAWALGNGIISGAALDVYEEEPQVHPDLLSLENVVLAPHLGSATTETRTAMADLAVRNTIAVLTGQSPITPVPGLA